MTPEAVTVPIRDFTSYKCRPIFERLGYMWRGYLPDRIHYLCASATHIDEQNQKIMCRYPTPPEDTATTGEDTNVDGNNPPFEIPYDILVIGTGATTNTFHTEGVNSDNCHFLKETGDANAIRNAMLHNLEKANLPHVPEEEKRRLRSFYVVGGGPTAVEYAAEAMDFLSTDVFNRQHSLFQTQCSNDCSSENDTKPSVTLVQSNQDCK